MRFQLAAFADESSSQLSGQIEALKRNGYQFLEIRGLEGKNVTQLTVQEAQLVKRQLHEHGLSIRSVGSPIGKIDIGDDFNAHIELYRHTLELANVFGAQQIRLFSFFMPKGEAPERYRETVLERMAVFARLAKEHGITACHENEKGIYGDIASRCLELHQAVPELRAVFDPANFIQCGQDTWQAWEKLHPYVEYMHIKDALADGCVVPAGQGLGNIPRILREYAAQGGKVLSLEPHLSHFVGLQGLERPGDESIVGVVAFATAEEAFDHAARALRTTIE